MLSLLSLAASVSLLGFADESPNPATDPSTAAASALIQDVARTCANLHSYVVRAAQSSGEFGRPGNSHVVTTAVNDSNHFAFRRNQKESPVIVGNGSTVRQYHPRLREYIDEPFSANGPGMRLFIRMRDQFVTRFATIDNYAASAKPLGTKQLAGGLIVQLVEISSKPGQSLWKDRLWIDPATRLVHKVVRFSTPASPASETYFDEVKFQYSYLNETVPQTYFDLKMAANARPANRFSFRGGMYSDPPMSNGPLGAK